MDLQTPWQCPTTDISLEYEFCNVSCGFHGQACVTYPYCGDQKSYRTIQETYRYNKEERANQQLLNNVKEKEKELNGYVHTAFNKAYSSHIEDSHNRCSLPDRRAGMPLCLPKEMFYP